MLPLWFTFFTAGLAIVSVVSAESICCSFLVNLGAIGHTSSLHRTSQNTNLKKQVVLTYLCLSVQFSPGRAPSALHAQHPACRWDPVSTFKTSATSEAKCGAMSIVNQYCSTDSAQSIQLEKSTQ